MNLLGRARKMLQGLAPAEPAKPQYYRVACAEGHVLRGERTEGYQALRCPSCGDGIFVLPKSPLPDPPAPSTDRPRKRIAAVAEAALDEGPIVLTDPPPQVDVAEVEIEWQDDSPQGRVPEAEIEIPAEPPAGGPAEEPPRTRPRAASERKPRVGRPKAAPLAAAQAARPRPHAAPAIPMRVRTAMSERIRRHRHALVIGGVILIVAATFAVRRFREHRQNLPQIAQKNTTEGLAALESGEFDVAKKKLAIAARALDELRDDQADKIRQNANEAAILADLAGNSLEEIVEEVATRDEGPANFRTLYRGRSVLLSVVIDKLPDPNGLHGYELKYKVLGGTGGRTKRGRVDLTGFTLFETAGPKVDDQVTFGGRLESITLGEDNEWRIRLAPDSGVRIISPQAWKGAESINFVDRAVPGEAATTELRPHLVLASILILHPQGAVPEVEPADLTKRPELIDHELIVDGRVQGTLGFHKDKGFDELRLVKSPVVFRLPPKFSFERPPLAPVVRVRGILKKEGDRFVVDVTAPLEILPSDLERLDRAVADLPANEAKGREAWAAWAQRRGTIYGDARLRTRGKEVLGDAFRAESARPVVDTAAALALADRARAADVPAFERSALAHRAFRPMIRRAATAAELDRLLPQIEAYFPDATKAPNETDTRASREAYAADPADAYRRADARVRGALDRQLWADALQKDLELHAREQPKDALALGEQARTKLPERPKLAAGLQNQGLEAAGRDVGSLHRDELESLVKIYRDELLQPERANELIRRWLDDQRTRLSPNEAEDRVLLASQYESMLGDKVTAEALLREAWKIDPLSKITTDVFRRRGYRLVDGEWQAPAGAPDKAPAAGEAAIPPPGRDPYAGLLRDEVKNLLGKPERIARCATQGQIVEQWIYQKQYITFVKRAGMAEPAVVAHYTAR